MSGYDQNYERAPLLAKSSSDTAVSGKSFMAFLT